MGAGAAVVSDLVAGADGRGGPARPFLNNSTKAGPVDVDCLLRS